MGQGAFQGWSRCSPAAGRRRRRGAGAVLALAVAGSLAGCSPTAEPGPGPEPTGAAGPSVSPSAPAPSPSPEPTAEEPAPVTAPTRPAEMDRADETGAIAAAEYFMRLSEYAFLTGDLSTWEEISTADCGYCNNVKERVNRVWGAGGRIDGAQLRVASPRIRGRDEQLGIYAVEVDYVASPAQELDSTGGVLDELPGGEGIFVVEVVPAPEGWRLVEAARPSPPGQ